MKLPAIFRRKKQQPTNTRYFKAANLSRLTEGWNLLPQPTNYVVRTALRQLVARSRDAWENNPYIKRYVDVLCANVIGHQGIQAHPCAKQLNDPAQLDEAVNQIIHKAWHEWTCNNLCDVAGRLDFCELQRLVLKTVAIDGEAFIRIFRDTTLQQKISLQLVDSQYIDVMFDKQLPNGNYIMQGIEYDKYNREIAFHVLVPQEPTSYSTYTPEAAGHYQRIPATEMLHIFQPFRVDQRRGIPMTTNSLEQLKILDGYLEAALVNARLAAANCGFISTTSGENDIPMADHETVNGGLSFDAEPGTIRQLPPNTKLEQFKTEYPSTAFAPFVKTILRQIAGGLGISYTALSNDIESVNYSSIRADNLQDRELFQTITALVISQFVKPVYEAWLETQLLTGGFTLATAGGHLKVFNLKHSVQLSPVRFAGRPFASIDAQKDATAQSLQILQGLRSRSDIIRRELGQEPDEVFAEIAAEDAKLKALGLNFGQNASATAVEDLRENL